mgnify:FL=1
MDTHLTALRGKSVLIVDDSPDMTSLLDDVLTASGARVVVAQDGRSAMQLIMDRHFDLVILDIIMPQPDGLAVLRFMQDQCPCLVRQTILLTGASHHSAIRCLEGLDVCLLLKPFDLRHLRGAACQRALSPTRPAA